jgi:hypothetical protein
LLSVQEATSVLDLTWQRTASRDALIDYCIIAQEIERRALKLSDSEKQELLDHFRRRRGLVDQEQTERWLENYGYTLDILVESLSFAGLHKKLQRAVAAERRESTPGSKLAAPGETLVARIPTKSESEAVELCKQLGGTPSLSLERFVIEASSRVQQGLSPATPFFLRLRHAMLTPKQAEMLKDAKPGYLVGPIPSGDGFDVAYVLRQLYTAPLQSQAMYKTE